MLMKGDLNQANGCMRFENCIALDTGGSHTTFESLCANYIHKDHEALPANVLGQVQFIQHET